MHGNALEAAAYVVLGSYNSAGSIWFADKKIWLDELRMRLMWVCLNVHHKRKPVKQNLQPAPQLHRSRRQKGGLLQPSEAKEISRVAAAVKKENPVSRNRQPRWSR